MIQKTILCFLLIVPFFSFSQDKIDLLILNKNYSEALKLIDSQLSQQPDADLFFRKSMVLKKQMLYPEALRELDTVLKLDSLNADYYAERADLYESLGDYDSAVKDYFMATSLQPGNLLMKYNLGQTYLRMSEPQKAVKVFEQVYELDSLNVMYNKYFALAVYKALKHRKAIDLYEKYLIRNPGDLSAYLNLANAYGELKNEAGVFQTLFRAKEKFPGNRIVGLKLANYSFLEARKYDDARRFYKEYMEKYDTTTYVLMNYGICLYHTKNEQEAINVLEQCYAEAPNDPCINFYLGVSHKKLANYDLAAKYLDFAIYISHPESLPEMYHHLGQVYGNMREFDKSIEALKRAYELDNRKVEVLFEIATTYEEFNFNSTMALNYYRTYLLEAGESAQNADYALTRMNKIKEDLFFEK
ncbi:MAG: tetratricopeptide repeat protein [Prolixibacteraceae bacterium]|jgi:tetratricopeptide (TPR) repeat protein|nr:tetratricopeptide repeat protein [Prolixibacteraceae bacterium]